MNAVDDSSKDVIQALRRYWWVILIVAVICSIASYVIYRKSLGLSSSAAGANGIVLGVWGLFISAAGFSLTIWQLAKTQSAARAAASAAHEVRSRVASYDAVVEASRVAALIRETQRHLKAPVWESAVMSYSQAREALIRLVELPSSISDVDRSALARVLADISALCDRIEAGILKNRILVDRGKALKASRDHEQVIARVSIALQREII